MGSKNPEAEVDAIFKALDNNNSGTIEYTGKKVFLIRYLFRKNI